MRSVSQRVSNTLGDMDSSPLNVTNSNDDDYSDANIRMPEIQVITGGNWKGKCFILSILLNIAAVVYFVGHNGTSDNIISLDEKIQGNYISNESKPNSYHDPPATTTTVASGSSSSSSSSTSVLEEITEKGEEEMSEINTEPQTEVLPKLESKSEIPTMNEPASVDDYMGKDLLIIDNLDLRDMSYWNPNQSDKQKICDKLHELSDQQSKSTEKTAVVKFSIPCKSYFEHSTVGTGNWINAIYAIRMSALTFENVGVQMECSDNIDHDEAVRNIIPWLMGYFPSWKQMQMQNSDLFKDFPIPSSEEACKNYDNSPIGYMAPFMQFDLRRMAIAIAGVQVNDHPSQAFAESYLWTSKHMGLNVNYYQMSNPHKGDMALVPDMELDEVAIQYACTYVLQGESNERVAFLKDNSYKNRIAPDVQSIGILVASNGGACVPFNTDLKEYLENAFPHAKVTIRDQDEDTQVQAYTRLIMANQTFGGTTSFGALPVVSTFGNGYLIEPRYKESKNEWVKLVEQHYGNINLMRDEEQLETFIMKSWMHQTEDGTDKVLYWLKADSQKLSDPYPPEVLKVLNDMVVKDSDLSYNSYWIGPTEICNSLESIKEIAKAQDPPVTHSMLNFTINCHRYFKESGMGTGNWISAIYGIRLAALTHGGVDVNMACDDAVEEQTKLILPWLMGYWPARDESTEQSFPWPYPDAPNGPMGLPSLDKACGNYYECPIGYMTPFIRYDLRRMAITVGGLPHESHPIYRDAKEYAEKYIWSDYYSKNSMDTNQLPMSKKGDEPLVPGLEFDDAAIHFRCGDIMGGVSHGSFGFMKFTAYKKWLSPEAKSIGIVTNPFDKDAQLRGNANAQIFDRCRKVVGRLKEYLEHNFPNAVVSVRNDVEETITTSYVRLLMANQTFASISSFGVFPVVATFGTGYLKKPDFPKVPNQWIDDASEFYEDIILMDEPERLMSGTVKGWLGEQNGIEKVLYWFENEDFKDTDPYPPH